MKLKGPWIGILKTGGLLAVGMVVMVGIIAWMAGLFIEKIPPGSQAQAAPARDLPFDQVHKVHKTYYEEAVGSLKAASRTEISSRVMAEITAIHVIAGQPVQEGETLIELDRRKLEAEVRRAQAQLGAAKAETEQAETNYRRMEALRKTQTISQSELDEATRRRDVAVAELDKARQAIEEANVLLSYTTIRAPKAGMIVDKLAQVGDVAQPGVPLLVLYDPASLRLEAPVMEGLAVQLRVGQKLTVHIDAIDADFEGLVDEIVPQAEAASRSFLVKVRLPRREELREGMYGRLLIPAGQRDHLCLNMDAIERIGQLEFVDVLRDDGTVERRFIRTGRIGMPGRIEVLSGLKEGEKVVLKQPSQAETPTTD